MLRDAGVISGKAIGQQDPKFEESVQAVVRKYTVATSIQPDEVKIIDGPRLISEKDIAEREEVEKTIRQTVTRQSLTDRFMRIKSLYGVTIRQQEVFDLFMQLQPGWGCPDYEKVMNEKGRRLLHELKYNAISYRAQLIAEGVHPDHFIPLRGESWDLEMEVEEIAEELKSYLPRVRLQKHQEDKIAAQLKKAENSRQSTAQEPAIAPADMIEYLDEEIASLRVQQVVRTKILPEKIIWCNPFASFEVVTAKFSRGRNGVVLKASIPSKGKGGREKVLIDISPHYSNLIPYISGGVVVFGSAETVGDNVSFTSTRFAPDSFLAELKARSGKFPAAFESNFRY